MSQIFINLTILINFIDFPERFAQFVVGFPAFGIRVTFGLELINILITFVRYKHFYRLAPKWLPPVNPVLSGICLILPNIPSLEYFLLSANASFTYKKIHINIHQKWIIKFKSGRYENHRIYFIFFDGFLQICLFSLFTVNAKKASSLNSVVLLARNIVAFEKCCWHMNFKFWGKKWNNNGTSFFI